MLHASTSTSPPSSVTPASSFFARLHSNPVQRSSSFTNTKTDNKDEDDYESVLNRENKSVGETETDGGLRKSKSLRTPGSGGTFGPSSSRLVDSRKDFAALSSFSAAGSDLASPNLVPTPPTSSNYTPPAASRHPLFSHHAVIPPTLVTSGSFMSDPGPSGPPSPMESPISSGAFSPASAFLSHFSSSSSLKGAPKPVAPDAQGAVVLDYTLGKILGRGGFSTVRQAIHIRTGEIMACKIVKRDDLSDRSGSLERFEDEIRIWQSLPRHPSVLPLLEMHRTPFATFLITPFLPGGSLLDVLRREGGSEKTARKWFPGTVAAVSALHLGYQGFNGGMLHGDLKLDNFLVDHQGEVMLGDYGMAQIVDQKTGEVLVVPTVPPPLVQKQQSTLPTHLHGRPRHSSPFPSSSSNSAHHHRPSPSPHHHSRNGHEVDHLPAQPFPSASLPYAPPELLRAPPSAPSLAQDIWALGVILHALLTGRLPFVDAFDPRLQMKILRGTWDEPDNLGHEWLECLKGCLEVDKYRRWDIARLKECDAVTGWREVKPRSKSRSRSRARPRDTSVNRRHGHQGFDFGPRSNADPLTSQAQPVPILSPSHHHHGRSRPRAYTARENGSIPPLSIATYPGDRDRIATDLFAPSPFLTGVPDGVDGSSKLREDSGSRSRSVSASRSRSSGRGGGHRGVFPFEPHRKESDPRTDNTGLGLGMDIDSPVVTRGRTNGQRRPADTEGSQQHSKDVGGQSGTGQSQSRNREDYLFRPTISQISQDRSSSPQITISPTRSSRPSQSPTTPTSRTRSTSRNRIGHLDIMLTSTNSDSNNGNGITGNWSGFASELDVVDEEGRQRDDRPVGGVGGRGRSRSRGRKL